MKTNLFFLILLLLAACGQAGLADIVNQYSGPPDGFYEPSNWTYGLPTNPSIAVQISSDLIIPAEATIICSHFDIAYGKQVNCYGTIDAAQYAEATSNTELNVIGGTLRATQYINLSSSSSVLSVEDGGSAEFYNVGPWTLGITGYGSVYCNHGRLKNIAIIDGSEGVTYYFNEGYISGPEHLDGDIDSKGIVDFSDLAILAQNWLME